MIVSSESIRERFFNLWPGLQFIVLTDPFWEQPTVADIRSYMNKLHKPPYVENIFECEEFAIEFVSELRKRRAAASLGMPGEKRNWPVGFVWGTKFSGKGINHFWNIAVVEEGIMCVERQTGEIRSASPDLDVVHFLFM